MIWIFYYDTWYNYVSRSVAWMAWIDNGDTSRHVTLNNICRKTRSHKQTVSFCSRICMITTLVLVQRRSLFVFEAGCRKLTDDESAQIIITSNLSIWTYNNNNQLILDVMKPPIVQEHCTNCVKLHPNGGNGSRILNTVRIVLAKTNDRVETSS
jgi:hypothetical protein